MFRIHLSVLAVASAVLWSHAASVSVAGAKEGRGVRTGMAAKDSAFLVWTEHALRKVDRRPDLDELRSMETVDATEVAAARNEGVSFQIVVSPRADRRMNQSPIRYPVKQIEPTTLEGPDDATIAKDRIDLHTVGYINGVHPDVLFPLTRQAAVPDRENYNLWVTVHIPKNIPPGDYRGTVRLTLGVKRYSHGNNILEKTEKRTYEVPFVVHVWDFALPDRTHVWTQLFTIEGGGGELTDWYAADRRPALKKALFKEYAERRISAEFITPRRVEEVPKEKRRAYYMKWAEWWVDRGLFLGRIPCRNRKRADAAACFDRYVDALRSRGWLDRAYARLPSDEGFYLGGDGAKANLQAGKLWKKLEPDLQRHMTFDGLYYKDTEPTKKLKTLRAFDPAVDIWSINPAVYLPYPKVADYLENREVSWYIHHHMKVAEPAVNLRLFFWKMWKRGVSQCTLWATCLWKRSRFDTWKAQRGFGVDPGFLGTGNGTLFWPGKEAVLPSIRADLIRDGIEDYEMHRRLRKLLANKKLDDAFAKRARRALAVPPEVVRSFFEFTDEPSALLRQRARVARLIEAASD